MDWKKKSYERDDNDEYKKGQLKFKPKSNKDHVRISSLENQITQLEEELQK